MRTKKYKKYVREYMRAYRKTAKGKAYVKAYKARPEWKLQLKGYNLRYKYGLDLCKLKGMLKAQRYACAICTKRLTVKNASVDHCHKTKSKRGILCNHCNLGLGHFRDKISLLQFAIKYLAQRRAFLMK